MVGVSHLFLPFAIVCLTLLGGQSQVESADDKVAIESARLLNFRHGLGQSLMPNSTASVFLPMAATNAWVMQIRESSAASSPDAEQKTPAAKSPSIIQMLEGRENDLILWLAIAVIFFVVGWICGGNYYLRRDRLRRTKLRF
jgi:hypothetical protein